MRVKITLRCNECKQRNYNTMKNKKNDPDRLLVAVLIVGIIVCLFDLGAGELIGLLRKLF